MIRIQNFYKDKQSAIKCILDFIVNALLINENKTIVYGQKLSKLTTSQLSTISIVFDMFIKKAHSLTIFIYVYFYCTNNYDKYKQFHKSIQQTKLFKHLPKRYCDRILITEAL